MTTIHHEQGSAPRVEKPVTESSSGQVVRYVSAAARISLGWVVVLAFLAEALGPGQDTRGRESWLQGTRTTRECAGLRAAGAGKGVRLQMQGQG